MLPVFPYFKSPALEGGQNIKKALPTTFSSGKNPQTWLSSLLFLLSPITKKEPSGTSTGP